METIPTICHINREKNMALSRELWLYRAFR